MDVLALSDEQLHAELRQVSADMAAAQARRLALAAELDRRKAWSGFKSSAHWLAFSCGETAASAREMVRVARVLAERPRLRGGVRTTGDASNDRRS